MRDAEGQAVLRRIHGEDHAGGARERPGEPGLPVILGEIGIDDEHRDALRRQPRKTLDDFVEESGGFRDRHLVIVEGAAGPTATTPSAGSSLTA